jgi:hypothetical protein
MRRERRGGAGNIGLFTDPWPFYGSRPAHGKSRGYPQLPIRARHKKGRTVRGDITVLGCPLRQRFQRASVFPINLRSEDRVATPNGFAQSATDFARGIGVQAHISMFGARLEYENFNVPNTSGAKIASLSVFLNL